MTSAKVKRPPTDEIASTLPWSCTQFGNQSEIEAFVGSTGKRETIADVHGVAGVDAEDMADFIVRAVNAYARQTSD
jgi:hypothetical protein